MKIVKGFAIVLFVLCFLLVISPVAAQDAPTPLPEPTVVIIDTGGSDPVEEAPVVTPPVEVDPSVFTAKDWILVAVIFGLLAFLALALRPLIIQLGQSAPKWAVEAAFTSANSLIEAALKRANETDSPLDNTVVEELRRELEQLRRDILGTPMVAAGLRAKVFPTDSDFDDHR